MVKIIIIMININENLNIDICTCLESLSSAPTGRILSTLCRCWCGRCRCSGSCCRFCRRRNNGNSGFDRSCCGWRRNDIIRACLTGSTPYSLHQLLNILHTIRIQHSTCGWLQTSHVDVLQTMLKTVDCLVIVAVYPGNVQIRATCVAFGIVSTVAGCRCATGAAGSCGGMHWFFATFDGHLLCASHTGSLCFCCCWVERKCEQSFVQ